MWEDGFCSRFICAGIYENAPNKGPSKRPSLCQCLKIMPEVLQRFNFFYIVTIFSMSDFFFYLVKNYLLFCYRKKIPFFCLCQEHNFKELLVRNADLIVQLGRCVWFSEISPFHTPFGFFWWEEINSNSWKFSCIKIQTICGCLLLNENFLAIGC